MSWARIKAILLHSWYHTSHSYETWIDLGWFTVINILVYGLLSKVLSQNTPGYISILMMGYIFWEVVRVTQYSIAVSLLWEIWSNSFSSLFITPLTIAELLTAEIISGTIKTAAIFVMTSILSAVFFHFNILVLGPMLLIYFVILVLFSYSAGLFITGLLFRYGTDIQSLAWGLIYLLQPLSALFYPVSALPNQIRWLAYISPITYVMESSRAQLAGQSVNIQFLSIATGLSTAYLVASWFYMKKMYTHSRQTGAFARLGN